jgi:hypothetical protein
MTGKKPERRSARERSRCQVGHNPGRPSCAEPAKIDVDGLVLCEKHTLEAKLEGQIVCWDAILAHVDLWSREASRREREDIVRLLDVERAKVTSAIERARSDLDLVRNEASTGRAPSGFEVLLKRGSLPLPPRSVRPLSRGLLRLRRR